MSEKPATDQPLPLVMKPVLSIECLRIACLAAGIGAIIGSSGFGLWIFPPIALLAIVTLFVEHHRIVKAMVSRGGTVEIKIGLRLTDAPAGKQKNILFREFPPQRKGSKIIAMDIEVIDDNPNTSIGG